MRSETAAVRTGFFAAVRRSSRPATFLAILIGLAFFSVATALPASASGLLLFNQTFENNTVPTSEVVLPDLPTGAAQSYPSLACLTAGGTPSGASSVPQCSDASDPNGSGYLRFTDTGGSEEGGVFSATSLPATQGLDVDFDSYQFGGSGADGIAFALAIANPTDPEPPAKIGDSGGSLGYGPCVDCGGGDNGLSYGYLGIGLDAYGNFSSTIPDGSDCSGQGDAGGSATPEAVSVRGPGNGEDGYCMDGGPWTDGSATLRSSTATAVPVEVAINPTGSTITTASGLSVSSDSYGVRWTPVGGTQQTETGALPNLNQSKYSDLGIPSSYYNSSGIPYQMTFGWVASTGGFTDYHEIRGVEVANGTGTPPPTFSLTASDNRSGEFGLGSTVGYTFTPSLADTSETGTITFNDTFPSGLTPTNTMGTDPSWSCSIVSATVTCTHAGVTAPATMPSIDIAASVAPNASTVSGALDDRGYVEANDALDADALDVGTAYGLSATTSLSPSSGTMAGGTQVAVTGTNYYDVSSVNVGSATVNTTCSGSPPFSDCFIVNSPTSITLYTPTGTSAGGIGAQTVTVTNGSGAGSGSTYTYTKAPTTTTVASSQNPSVSGQAVAFTANVTSGATGSVTFVITPSHGSTVACSGGDTVSLSAGTATCSIPADSLLAAGSTYAVSANYSGDGNNLTSTGSLSPVQTVNQSPTTTATPTSTVNPSIYGQTVTYTTTVSPTDPGAGIPTGVAQFEETVGGNTTTMCAGTLNGSGETSCTSSLLPPAGTASVQGTYLGDTNYLTSISSGLIQFVDQASTSTVLSSNLNPSGYENPVTFTATVSAVAPASGIPGGQIAFSADGTPISGCSAVVLNGSAQATCTTSSLSVASHTVVASYGGNADYLASSGSLVQTVGEETTTTSELSSQNPSVTGQGVTVTANVSYSGSGTPTGNVTFTITPASGVAPQCSGGDVVVLSASASAACTLDLSASFAPYHISAEYNGDSNYDASGTSVLTQNVTAASTTTSVSTSAPSAVTDQAVTFTATVASVSPGSGAPSDGTVGFDIGGTPVGGCATESVSSGTATCTVSDLTAAGGPYSVTAFYNGASDYASSNNSGSPLVQTVGPDPTSTSLSSNTNPSTFGQNVSFTATVTANTPGAGTPTGTATISVDGSTLCTGSLVSGQLICSSSTLSAGTHQLSATYSASTNYGASTSPTLTQGVNQAATTTTVTSSDNPSPFGDSVTITAAIAPVAPGRGTPTGLIDFSNGITPVCVNVVMSGGVATCEINYPVGSYTIVAAYRGSAGFAQSSGQMMQVVQTASTTSSVVSAPTVVTGQGSTYVAEVAVVAPGTTELANPTGTVSIYAQDTQVNPQILLCSTNVGLSGATVSCSSSAVIAAGSPWSITAVYSGDANFAGSTSPAVTQTVNRAATTTGVTAVVNPSVTGQTITATAGFTISSPGSDSPVAPTGTVGFEISLDGGATFNPISGCQAQAASWSQTNHAGSATCTLSSPPAVSSVELEAIYSGDPNFATSTSAPLVLAVNQASTTTTISADTNPSVSGETVNYTATVSVTPPGSDSTPPTGTVDFEYSADGGITWNAVTGCSTQTLTWDSTSHTGTSSCSTALAATSSGDEVQAVYSGDGNFDGSTSVTPVAQVVNPAPTTTAVALAPRSSVSGQSVTATATVSITAPGSDSTDAPTGSVAFQYSTDGGITWNAITGCSAQTLSWDSTSHTGTASCATAFDAASSPVEIRGIYSGDPNFSLSTSPSATETVNQAATSTSLTHTPNPSLSGQAVGLSATVSISSPGSDSPGEPTGSVAFQYSTDGGTIWGGVTGCSAQAFTWNSSIHTGTSSCSTAFEATFSGDEIQAVYSGDANFAGSTSPAFTQTVNRAVTDTGVSTVVSPSVTGQTITATAGFTIALPGSDSPVAPTGTVEFEISLDGGTTFNPISGCQAQVTLWNETNDAGSTTCTLASPPAVSSVELVGIYSGDANFAPSTSPPDTQVVNEAATSTTISAATNPSVSGETVNYTATVSVTPPGSDSTPPTGAVDFEYSTNGGITWNGVAGCAAQTLTWSSTSHTGSAPCATEFAASSSGVEVQAVYSGDGNFDGSTSLTPVTQVVNTAQTTIAVALAPRSSVSGQSVTATATVSITAPGSDSTDAPTGSVLFLYSGDAGVIWSGIPGCASQTLSWNPTNHIGTSSCVAAAFDAASSPVEVQAIYSGDPNFGSSASPSATETVSQAATTTSVIATPDVSVSGQPVGLSATVSISSPGSDSPAGASGTVDFQYSVDAGTVWSGIAGCSAEALSWNPIGHTGTSVCTTAFASTFSGDEIRTVYSGDSNFTGSASSPVTQTVTSAATSTSVTAVANPSVTGQTITATAGFTISSPGSDNPVAPTGTAEFEISLNDGSTFNPISGCLTQVTSWSVIGNIGSAACTLTSPSAVSSVELEAIYSGDPNFAGSTSAPITLLVNRASTSTGLVVAPNPSVSGETVDYTATVSVTPPGSDSTTPTGAVDFRYSTDGGVGWSAITGCATQTLTWNSMSGTASCAAAFVASSSGLEVQAEYLGDGNFYGSTSSTIAQMVNTAQTTTAVALAPRSSVSGQSVTATATVSITAPGSDSTGAPTGFVGFQYSTDSGVMWNGITGCAAQDLSWSSTSHTGTASCATAFDAVFPSVEIRAIYSGDPNFGSSTSPSATETVSEAATTTSVIATPDVSVSGQPVGLSATVSISSPGSDSPAGASGTVAFQYSANSGATWNDLTGCATQPLVWAAITHTGTSSCNTAFSEASSGDEIRAVYSGNASFTGSTSSPVTQTVSRAATATAVDTSANPSVNGQTITVDATVTVAAPGSDITISPTGSALFESSTDGGSVWGSVPGCSSKALSWSGSAHDGTATCSVQLGMSQSGIQFEAYYAGDPNFVGSDSGPVTQTVGQGRTSTVVNSTPDSSGPLQPVTFVARVSVVAPAVGALTGTVTFTDGGSTLCAAFALGSSGTASCTSHLPITASQSVVADYSGNSVFSGSSGSMLQNVRHGYWLLGADGGVFSYGNAQFYGSLPQIGYSPAGSGGPHQLKAPLVGITSTVSGNGYWLVASDGGVFSFGDAAFYGSTGAKHLNKPVVAMAVTPDGKGYWLVASDGGVFSFGDAAFYGSTGAMHLNKPIVAMAAAPDGKGYWLIASDGGVFAFGDAHYFGSPSTGTIPEPIVGIARSANGEGYWMAASSGRVYSYGNAGAVTDAAPTNSPVVGIDGTADGRGYWMSTASGGVFTYGDAKFDGSAAGIALQRPIVGMSGL